MTTEAFMGIVFLFALAAIAVAGWTYFRKRQPLIVVPTPPGGDWVAAPKPPGIHWVAVMMLMWPTLGIFGIVYLFKQAAYAQRLGTGSKALWFYGGAILAFVAMLVSAVLLAVFGTSDAVRALTGVWWLLIWTLDIAGRFSIKKALEDYYGLRLSGPMTFFFNVYYFQHHLHRIGQLKAAAQSC